MFKNASRAMAVAALVPIALMVSALPSHAQVDEEGDVTVDGTVDCDTTTGTYTVNWVIDNQLTVNVPERQAQATGAEVTVLTAVESEALTGDVLAGITPNPIPAFSQATVSDGPIPNSEGQVTLEITWTSEENKGTAFGTLGFDGTCAIAETTTTAPAAEAAAVAAEPAFTG